MLRPFAKEWEIYPSKFIYGALFETISHVANRNKNGKTGAASKAGAPNAAAKGIGNGSSPTALNKKISYENSL